MKESDDKEPDIIDRILTFLARYNTFTARTGITFSDFMDMDPSTAVKIQNTWIELSRPEEAKMEEEKVLHDKLQKQLSKLNK